MAWPGLPAADREGARMKKNLRIGFIPGAWLFSPCSVAVVAGEQARQGGPADPPSLRAEEYPLGDVPLDPSKDFWAIS